MGRNSLFMLNWRKRKGSPRLPICQDRSSTNPFVGWAQTCPNSHLDSSYLRYDHEANLLSWRRPEKQICHVSWTTNRERRQSFLSGSNFPLGRKGNTFWLFPVWQRNVEGAHKYRATSTSQAEIETWYKSVANRWGARSWSLYRVPGKRLCVPNNSQGLISRHMQKCNHV